MHKDSIHLFHGDIVIQHLDSLIYQYSESLC